MALESNPQNKPRKRGAWYAPLMLLAVCAVALVAMSMLFRVSVIQVVNGTDYTDAEIIDASGIEKGANLFFIDRFSAASKIFAGLSYVDAVSLERELPNKIIIQIDGSAAVAYVDTDDGCWVINRDGKLLESSKHQDSTEYVHILGITPADPTVGENMVTSETDGERLDYALTLVDALTAEQMLDPVSWIDVRDTTNPSLSYDDRLTVYLGANEEVPYKIALLSNVLSQLTENDTGSLRYTEGTTWTFSPD